MIFAQNFPRNRVFSHNNFLNVLENLRQKLNVTQEEDCDILSACQKCTCFKVGAHDVA